MPDARQHVFLFIFFRIIQETSHHILYPTPLIPHLPFLRLSLVKQMAVGPPCNFSSSGSPLHHQHLHGGSRCFVSDFDSIALGDGVKRSLEPSNLKDRAGENDTLLPQKCASPFSRPHVLWHLWPFKSFSEQKTMKGLG